MQRAYSRVKPSLRSALTQYSAAQNFLPLKTDAQTLGLARGKHDLCLISGGCYETTH